MYLYHNITTTDSAQKAYVQPGVLYIHQKKVSNLEITSLTTLSVISSI